MTALTQTDNPIIWQEFNHQQRSAPRFLRRGWLFGLLLLMSMIALVASTLTQIDNPTRELALYVIWLVHAATAVRAIIAGTNAISREHVGQTWDALVLTGVSARQILFGKWRAALRRVAPWMLALGTIRLVMLPIFILALLNRFAWRVSSYGAYNGYNSYGTYDNLPLFSWELWAVILAVVATVFLTILETLCCTMLGLAASAITRRGVLATVIAFTIRFAPVAMFAAFTRYELGAVPSYRVMRFPPFAIADGGTSPVAQLVLPLMPWTYNIHSIALSGLLMASAVLVVMLVVSVLVAWAAIRHTGALPHPKVATVGNSFHAVTEG